MLHENILHICDENSFGTIFNEWQMSFDRVEVSVRDVITERVMQEVIRYNQSASMCKFDLVQPTELERQLNGPDKKRPPVDVDKQIAIALQAFKSNGFFIFIGDNQVESLDDIITIRPQTRVSFIKLTPLVGG